MTDNSTDRVEAGQGDRPISEHPCHGLFATAGDRLTHRHWFQDGEVMPTCERCGTPINRKHEETGPMSWAPEKRRNRYVATPRPTSAPAGDGADAKTIEILRRALAWHGDPQRLATTREEWQQTIDDAIAWVKDNPEPDRPSFSTLAALSTQATDREKVAKAERDRIIRVVRRELSKPDSMNPKERASWVIDAIRAQAPSEAARG